jgi:hypothetical protein
MSTAESLAEKPAHVPHRTKDTMAPSTGNFFFVKKQNIAIFER